MAFKGKTVVVIGASGVVGDFRDENAAGAAGKSITSACDGAAIDHVVSVQGFVAFAKAPTETPVDDLRRALDDGLLNNYLAGKVLLPDLRSREGATFTLVSGGLAHIPPPICLGGRGDADRLGK